MSSSAWYASLLYVAATALLIPATATFFKTFADHYTAGIWALVVATSMLTLAALITFYEAISSLRAEQKLTDTNWRLKSPLHSDSSRERLLLTSVRSCTITKDVQSQRMYNLTI